MIVEHGKNGGTARMCIDGLGIAHAFLTVSTAVRMTKADSAVMLGLLLMTAGVCGGVLPSWPSCVDG